MFIGGATHLVNDNCNEIFKQTGALSFASYWDEPDTVTIAALRIEEAGWGSET